jgi:hypothetical protein
MSMSEYAHAILRNANAMRQRHSIRGRRVRSSNLQLCQAVPLSPLPPLCSQVNLMQCLVLPVGPQASPSASSDALKLGLLRVALLAVGCAAELEAASCIEAYPETTRHARAALLALAPPPCTPTTMLPSGGKAAVAAAALASPRHSRRHLRLPEALERLRSEVLGSIEATAAAAVAARRPLARPVTSSKALGSLGAAAREYNPRWACGGNLFSFPLAPMTSLAFASFPSLITSLTPSVHTPFLTPLPPYAKNYLHTLQGIC